MKLLKVLRKEEDEDLILLKLSSNKDIIQNLLNSFNKKIKKKKLSLKQREETLIRIKMLSSSFGEINSSLIEIAERLKKDEI